MPSSDNQNDVVTADSLLAKGANSQIPSTPSLSDIKRTIPADLFRPSLLKSFQYVALDLTLVATNFVLMYYLQHIQALKYITWPLYWFFQGTFFWSIFVFRPRLRTRIILKIQNDKQYCWDGST